MKISLVAPDPAMPRTVYYDQLCQAIMRNSAYTADASAADVVFPAEDTAVETNWPRYGNPTSAYIRGQFDQQTHFNYLNRLASTPLNGAARMCMVNMHPGIRLSQMLAQHPKMVIADLNIHRWERAQNPRTISMPALPIISGQRAPGNKTILASFRGAPSHPSRMALQRIANGSSIICQLIDPANHKNRIDATKNVVDTGYVQLLEQSVFAFVPRGDCMFSYRLAEVMSFGCIPVILSDGWVLPFDRTIPWDTFAIHHPEPEIGMLPQVLQAFAVPRLQQMMAQSLKIYQAYFSTMDAVVDSLLRELALPAVA